MYSNTETGQILSPECVYFPSSSVKSVSCLIMFRHLITLWHLNTWKVKNWLSQEWKELLKWNKKIFFLVSQVLSFRHTKQTGKNVPDTIITTRCWYMSIFHNNKLTVLYTLIWKCKKASYWIKLLLISSYYVSQRINIRGKIRSTRQELNIFLEEFTYILLPLEIKSLLLNCKNVYFPKTELMKLLSW